MSVNQKDPARCGSGHGKGGVGRKGEEVSGKKKECERGLEVSVQRGQGRDELKRDGRDGIEMGRDEPSK